LAETVFSKNNFPIRLTDERWAHIIEEHCELAGMRFEVLEALANPSRILQGNAGELLALRRISIKKYLVAVYRESEDDGFVITAFVTSRIRSLNRRKQLWPEK
jgi:hypothetical protein